MTTDHRLPSRFACAMLLALGACSSLPSGDGSRPLTPEEIEYQRRLENYSREPLDASGRAQLMVKLDRTLSIWGRTNVEQLGSEDRKVVDNLEEVLERDVYQNFDAVLDVYANGDPEQRLVAAAALGFCRLKEPDDPGLRDDFRSRWPPVYPRAVEALVRGLDSDQPVFVQNCLLGLWKIGDATTPTAPLVRLLSSDRVELRSHAALALSTILTPETGESAIGALLNALYDADPKVRNHAVSAVIATKHRDAAGRLAQMLDDPYLLIEANAARGLADLGDWRNCQYLIDRLDRFMKEKPSGRSREKTDLDERRAFISKHLVSALQDLSGKNFGDDMEKWHDWWSERSAGGT